MRQAPPALLAALAASLGLHLAALCLPDIELPGRPGPAERPLHATLQAPRSVVPAPAPAAAPPSIPPRRPARRPPPALPEPLRPASPADPETAPRPPAPPPPAEPATEPVAQPAVPERDTEAEAAPPGPHLPPAGRIDYAVYRGDRGLLIGRARHEWSIGDGRYRITASTETAGLAALIRPVRIETESRGRIGPQGFIPTEYVSRRPDKGREDRVELDPYNGTASIGGRTEPTPPGVQDLLSFHYQAGALPRLESGVEVGIVTARRLERLTLDVRGEAGVETPLGTLRTLHVVLAGARTTTEFWLWLDRLLLPVKIRYLDRDGESYEQVATEIILEP